MIYEITAHENTKARLIVDETRTYNKAVFEAAKKALTDQGYILHIIIETDEGRFIEQKLPEYKGDK